MLFKVEGIDDAVQVSYAASNECPSLKLNAGSKSLRSASTFLLPRSRLFCQTMEGSRWKDVMKDEVKRISSFESSESL